MVKLRIVSIIVFCCFSLALIAGILIKDTYKDFDKEEKPLEEFYAGIFPDNLLDMQLELFDEELDNSPIIIAAKCVDSYNFLPNCYTQSVEVEKVFSGNLKIGEKIEIAKYSAIIYKTSINGHIEKGINMSFVNEMKIGETYLIFLDRKLDSHTQEQIYIQADFYLIAPIFAYNNIENKPLKSITNSGNWIDYKSAKDNEYFLMSQKNVDEMNAFKEKVLAKYPLD